MLKAGISLSKTTRIELGDDTPLRISFEIVLGKLEYYEYYLAPTLQS